MAARYTIYDLNRAFPGEDTCLEYVKETSCPRGITRRKPVAIHVGKGPVRRRSS